VGWTTWLMPLFFKKKPNTLSVLFKFRPLWCPKNQGLCSFDPKTYFSTYFLTNKKTPIKHLRSHERPNYDIKNPKNHLKNWTKLEFKYIFSWTFKIHKHLIWTSLSNVTIWYKYSLFWRSRSVSIKYFSLYRRNPTISLSFSSSTRNKKI